MDEWVLELFSRMVHFGNMQSMCEHFYLSSIVCGLVCGKKPYLVLIMRKALEPLIIVLYHSYMLISFPKGLTH